MESPTHYGIEPNLGPARPAKKCPGYAAGDLRFTGLTSTKGLRISDRESGRQVNVKTAVGVSAGTPDARFGRPQDATTHRPPFTLDGNSRHDRKRRRKFAAHA